LSQTDRSAGFEGGTPSVDDRQHAGGAARYGVNLEDYGGDGEEAEEDRTIGLRDVAEAINRLLHQAVASIQITNVCIYLVHLLFSWS